MRVRKRLCCIVCLMLLAIMLFNVNAISVFAEKPIYPYGSVVLAELNKMSWDGAGQKSNATLDNTVKYSNASGTVKYMLGVNGSTYWAINRSLGELGSGELKIRFYSEAVGAKCAFVFRNSSTGDMYGWKPIVVEKEGWQEFSLKSTEAMFKNAINGSADQIVFNGYGFNLGTQFLGKSINIDSVWFEYPIEKWDSMEVISTSIANGQGYVPAALDGSNTLTFEFENELWDGNYDEAVAVYEDDGETERPVSIPYSVSVEDNKLNIVFDSELSSPMTYKAVLLPNKIFDNSDRVLKSEYVLGFLVGKGGVLSITESNIIDGMGYVSGDIDGNNTVYFEFENTLSDEDFSEAVIVYEMIENEYREISGMYTVRTEGNKLKIVFENELDPKEYKIALLPNIISDILNCRLNELYEVRFFVDTEPREFYVRSVSNGADEPVDAGQGYEYVLNFNSLLPQEAKDKITVYRSGYKMYRSLSVSVNERAVSISFDSLEADSIYTIKLADDFSDISGKIISGEKVFDFSTKSASDNPYKTNYAVLYSSSGSNAIPGGKFVNDNTNLYDKTTRYDFDATVSQKTVVIERQYETGRMNYLNCWVYSPEASDKNINYVLYSDGTASYDWVKYPLNWQGWKLISIPISSFPAVSASGTLYKFVINLGGFGELWEHESYIMIDEIWLSENEPQIPEVVSASMNSGDCDIPISNASITYSFNTEIASVQKGVISIVDSQGGKFTDYAVNYGVYTMTLRFGELMPSETYTVSVDNVFAEQPAKMKDPYVLSFSTAKSSYEVTNISFPNAERYTSGEKINAEFSLKNSMEIPVDVILNLNIYTDDGALLRNESKNVTLEAGAPVTENLSAFAVSNSGYAKAFVTVKDGNRLVSDLYAVLNIAGANLITPESVNISGAESSIDFDGISINGEYLTIIGTVHKVKNTLLICLQNEKREIITTEPVFAQRNGSFIYNYKFSESEDTASIDVSLYGSGISDTAELIYVSAADRERLTSLAGGTSRDALYAFLKEKSKYFGLSGCTDEVINDIAAIILENEAYDGYSGVTEMIKKAYSILPEFNSLIWGEMAKYILDNHKLLLNDGTYYEKFKNSDDGAKNKICQNIARSMPYASISAIRQKFNSVMSAGVSDGGSSVTITGGGGGSGSVLSGSPPAAAVQPTQAFVFNDLQGFEWASENILSLYNKGVIAPSADKKFRPSDSITREEFVKMLVSMLYGNVTGVTGVFSDMAQDAWYAPYISKAYEEGIVSGKEDGSFGIGERISRQDIAVMGCRALEAIGVDVTYDSSLGFTDSEEISDYAKRYVGALCSIGVISGMGDGSFAPMAYANRAQAARIISELHDIYK